MDRKMIKAKVLEELKKYPELKKKVVLLHYEQEHPAKLSDSEGLTAWLSPIRSVMRSSHRVTSRTRLCASLCNSVTEKTALTKKPSWRSPRNSTVLKVRSPSWNSTFHSWMQSKPEVIQKYYFERKTWVELQQEMHLSPRTLIKRRDEGLEALVDIYEYLGQITKQADRDKIE